MVDTILVWKVEGSEEGTPNVRRCLMTKERVAGCSTLPVGTKKMPSYE